VVVYNILLLLHVTPRLFSYDATALAMIQDRNILRLDDPLLQPGALTGSNSA